MSRPALATYVHVADDNGKVHVFGPQSPVPEWATSKITNPKAWVGGNVPKAEDPAAEMERLRARLAELESTTGGEAEPADGPKPPPRAGAGSGRDNWAAYAAGHDVEVPEGATREQIIQALDEAKVPTE